MLSPCFRSCKARLKQTIATWRKRFREYAERCIESGFVPLSFGWVQFITRQLARILVFVQLGRLRLIGAGNLRLKGRFIYCPNHSSLFDAPVLYSVMNRPRVRYMTAMEEMRGLWGLKAVVMGAMGSFPVDRTKGKSVIQPAIDMLVKGNPLVIFPEGKISATGECLPFKKGPALIGKAALAQLPEGERVGIVPINIFYHKRDVATAKEDFFKMGLKWRGGVTVTAGEPIYLDGHTDCSEEEIMNLVRKTVCQAQAAAKSAGCPCGE